jgi:UDP-N-acetylmuramoyl-tripeptide--D-alanyl-D-alanine ligase
MNHPGEIATLSAIAQPTVALVNNAQREHLEFMASVQAVAQENGCVIDALAQSGVAVFPSDDFYSELWAAKAGQRSQLRFRASAETSSRAEVRCSAAVWSDHAWQVNLSTPAGPLRYTLHIAGLHNVRNSLAAVACSLAVGVPLDSIAQGLAAFKPVKGRSCVQLIKQGRHATTLVDDSYNANPDSVLAAIDVLAQLPGPRLLVLGDMGEVGAHGPEFHAQAGQVAYTRGIDALFTLGDLSAVAAASFGVGRHFDDLQALQAAVLAALPQMGSVLVKGSRFMRMERLVQAILAHTEQPGEVSHAA